MKVPTNTRDRLTAEGKSGESFRPSTAAAIVKFVKAGSSTAAEREQVIAIARTAIDDDVLPEAERKKLVKAGYKELDS